MPATILYCEGNVDGTIGGSYYSLLYLVSGLDRRKYRPVVVFATEHALLPAFAASGVETRVWPNPRPFTFGTRIARRWGTVASPLQAVQRLLNVWTGLLAPTLSRMRFLKASGVVLVHLNNSVLRNHTWMLAAWLTATKCVTHERGLNDHYPPLARFLARRLDAIICISNAVRDQMESRGVGVGRLVTIRNGLDPQQLRIQSRREDLRAAYRCDSDEFVVVMLGNIKQWKGQEVVVRAIERVRQSCPGVRCFLVGDASPSDAGYAKTVRDLVVSLALEKHITFTGFHHNVADFLVMSDVVVHASVRPEPFGRVVLEAMACHQPVIGSRAGAIPEIVVEGETGLLFRPGDSVELADAITRLARDRDLARRMGEQGYQRLVSEFPIARNIEATEGLYERLLGVTA